MARPLRIEYKGVFYHRISRGNERRRICFAKLDYGRFKEKGRRYHCQFVLIQGLTPFFYITFCHIYLAELTTKPLRSYGFRGFFLTS